jgi:hypothetical protein
MSLPPLPAGATLIDDDQRRPRRDPWEILREAGFEANNGYRAPGDIERIRAQGYRPATNSHHNRGDAVDLRHPTLRPADQERRARELFGDWPGAEIMFHDGHLHLGLPGWGAAPGTPGTPNFGLPALPPGAELTQRGAITPGNFDPSAGAGPPAAPPPASPSLARQQPPRTSVETPPPVMQPREWQPNMTRDGSIRVYGHEALNQPRVNEQRRDAISRAFSRIHAGVSDDEVLADLEAAGQSISPALQIDGSYTVRGELALRRELGLEEYRRRTPGYTIDPAAYSSREYSGFGDDLLRGVAGLGTTVDTLATHLEDGARRVVGSENVDAANEWYARHYPGGNPQGARGSLAQGVNFLNSIPRNPELSATMERAANQPGTVSAAGSFISDIARNPSAGLHLLAEMAPSFAVGGVFGKGAANLIPSATGATARMMAAGAGFGTGQTLAQMGPNIANLTAQGMPFDEAVNRGTRMTLGQVPGAAVSGAAIPFRPFTGGLGAVGNVAAQVPIQAAGGAASIYGGNVFAGLATRPQDIGIAAATNALLSPVDFALGGYFRQSSQPRPPRGIGERDLPPSDAAGPSPVRVESRGDGAYRFTYERDGHQIAGNLRVDEQGNGTVDVLGGQANGLGPAAVREALRGLQQAIPGLRTIGGVRTSGTRAGNPTATRVNLGESSDLQLLFSALRRTVAAARASDVQADPRLLEAATRNLARIRGDLIRGGANFEDIDSIIPFGEYATLAAAGQHGPALSPDGIDVGIPQDATGSPLFPPRPQDRLDAMAYEPASRSAAMDAEGLAGPEIVGPPARQVDRIDVDQLPPLPPGARLLEDPLGNPPRRGESPAGSDLSDIARRFDPADALPRPTNRVRSIDEHLAAAEGRWEDVAPANERRELPVHRIPNPRRPGETIRFQNVIDAETAIRMAGGLRDEAGELAHLGITNNRPRPEVPGEDRLGRILNPKSGMSLDEAAFMLWERGYFPHMTDRPTVDDLLEVLRASRNGQRTVLPQDIDTLDAYHQAQAQRWAVESAAQDGSILSDDPTRPVTVDEREQPPVTAYEDLPDRLSRVSNINLAHIESADDIGRLLQNVETAFGGFNAARRGRISHEETEALARELGMTADDLLRRRPGQALNAEQALAARSLLAKSSDEVIALAQRARNGSEADRAAFAEALLRHAAIQEQVTGAIAEAGRALSSLRAAAKSRAVSNRIHEITQHSLGGQNRLEEIANGILELQRAGVEPGQVNRFAADAIKPKLSDKLVELWYNSLLSGPQTHVVNTLSNMMTGVLQFPEQATAAAIGKISRGVGRVRGRPDDFDRVTFSEIGPRVIGYLQGTREGLSSGWHTLRTGEVSDHVTKVESRLQEAISGRKGKLIRAPSRFLAAEDEIFKAVARRMELAALAARKARSEGLRGDAYRQRVEDLTRNPTDEMMERVLDYARYLTFQKPLGSVGSRISGITSDHPWLKLFVPFIRTPTNLFKYTLERSPAAPLMRQVRNDWKAGGERRHVAMARMMLGTGLALTIGQLVEQGLITGGGPASPGAEDLLRADGWQPYSVKIGGTYYSYQRLDPLAMTIGIAADLMDYQSVMTARQSENAAALLTASIINNLGNKTWLSGISDLVEAVSNPEMNGGSFIGRLAGSLAVPTGVNQVARWVDPVQRETRAPSYAQDMEGSFYGRALGSIQNRVPYWSQQLPARRDVFGREMRSEGGAGPDLVSPIWTRAARNDPIIAELLNIQANIGRPQRSMTRDGERVRLTPEQFGRYQELSGRYIYEDIQAAMADPEWRTLDAEQRRREVANIKRDARADARADLALDAPTLPPGAQLLQ